MTIPALILSGLLLLQIVSMNMLFVNYAKDLINKFEERRLQIAVNYAVDAASQEMVNNSANLGQDYESIARLNVDPTVAMDTFATMICKNYSIPVNTTNQQSILTDYCPVFVVATYDGYYVADFHDINVSGVYNYVFGTKMPYSEVVEVDVGGGNTETRMYSYNMGFTSAIYVDEYGGVYRDYNPPRSYAEQKDIVNTTISDVLNEQLLKNTPYDLRGEMYIPADFTALRSTNPIDATTVFVYIDEFDLPMFGLDLQSFGIGGSDIENKKVVVGFTLTGENGVVEKYYAYSDQVPDDANRIETFDSQEDAAAHGYYYYIA